MSKTFGRRGVELGERGLEFGEFHRFKTGGGRRLQEAQKQHSGADSINAKPYEGVCLHVTEHPFDGDK